jgi:hypothetical protein
LKVRLITLNYVCPRTATSERRGRKKFSERPAWRRMWCFSTLAGTVDAPFFIKDVGVPFVPCTNPASGNSPSVQPESGAEAVERCQGPSGSYFEDRSPECVLVVVVGPACRGCAVEIPVAGLDERRVRQGAVHAMGLLGTKAIKAPPGRSNDTEPYQGDSRRAYVLSVTACSPASSRETLGQVTTTREGIMQRAGLP